MTCNRCGGPHPFDTSIDNATWNRVIRQDGPERDDEFLCLCCIVKAFAVAGEGFEARLCGPGVGITTIYVTPPSESAGEPSLIPLTVQIVLPREKVAQIAEQARNHYPPQSVEEWLRRAFWMGYKERARKDAWRAEIEEHLSPADRRYRDRRRERVRVEREARKKRREEGRSVL